VRYIYNHGCKLYVYTTLGRWGKTASKRGGALATPRLALGVWGLEFFVLWCLLFAVWGLEFFALWFLLFGVWGLEFFVLWCLVFGVWCLVFGVSGSGFGFEGRRSAGSHTSLSCEVDNYRGTSLIRNTPPPLGPP